MSERSTGLPKTISDLSTTLWGSIGAMGISSTVLANIINNQPMTILMTHVLVNDAFTLSGTIFSGSAYALVIGSNLGANLTIIGALAGIMWRQILKEKGVTISYKEFLLTGMRTTPIVLAVTLATLYGVLQWLT